MIHIMILIIGFSFVFPQNVFAAEQSDRIDKAVEHQIIFLLDASKSMRGDGQWIEAADSACMIASALPEGYEAALLVYNAEIVYQEDFGNITQRTRRSLESVELKGYTTPAMALEKAFDMFDSSCADKRIVVVSDGEISMMGEQETQDAVDRFERAVDTAAAQKIKIDMFEVPTEDVENQVSYATTLTSGELHTVGENHAIEEIAARYLFQTLQLEKIELGESFSDEGKLSVDLQDTYMQNAKILFVSGDIIQNFHVTGQCEQLMLIQGSKFAVAQLQNPMEKQAVMDYCLEGRGNTHAYLIKEYYLETEMDSSYTSEDGSFSIEVNVLNHQGQLILDADDIRQMVSVLVDGEEQGFEISGKTAVIPYQTSETRDVTVEIEIDSSNSVLHYDSKPQQVELIVPVTEKQPDYTVLWIVVAALCGIIAVLSIIFLGKKQKKKPEEGAKEPEIQPEPPAITRYDFSGQLKIYLLKGETQEDLAPCSVKLFGLSQKSFSFDWIKDCCGISYYLTGAGRIKFTGGKDHALCIRNDGDATIIKDSQVLNRGKKYALYYGEKVLLIFNDGGTEMELHYKNMKPSER